MCSCSRSLSRPRIANKMLEICFHLCWLPMLPSRKAGKELSRLLAESHYTRPGVCIPCGIKAVLEVRGGDGVLGFVSCSREVRWFSLKASEMLRLG